MRLLLQIKAHINYISILFSYNSISLTITSMSSISTYSNTQDIPTLHLDEKLIAITIFYKHDHHLRFDNPFPQSKSMQQKIDKMVLHLIQAIIYLSEQELRNRGYLRGTLEIKYLLKSLAKTVFRYAKTNEIFKKYIQAFFNYGKIVDKFTNEELIIFYNAVIQEDDRQKTAEIQKMNQRSEKENDVIDIESQNKNDSNASTIQQRLPHPKIQFQSYSQDQLEHQADVQTNHQIRLGINQMETMSVIQVQGGLSKESQQLIELFTRQMKVPKKYERSNVVMTKTMVLLKKGQPHYTHEYYDSLEGGKIRIVFVGPSST